jgi:lysine-N-methylase
MLMIHYSLIKMLLIGMAGYYKENFNLELMLKLIQSFGKSVEHSSKYLNYVLNLLKKNNYTSLAYMVILCNN